VFFRWLFTRFPLEMRRAWQLVQRDLSLWLALFGLLALVAVYGAEALGNRTDAPLALLWLTIVPLFINFLAVVLFDAAASDRELGLSNISDLLWDRGLAFVGYVILTGLVLFGAAGAVQGGLFLLLRDSEIVIPVSWLVGFLVAMTLRVRFCFVPFLVILHRAEAVRGSVAGQARSPLAASIPPALTPWPLIASDRLGETVRWSIAPYVVIAELGALPSLLVPPAFVLPALIIGQVLILTARGVLFHYFLALREKYGIITAAEPAAPAPE
jgi:hypothetical protein